jgi:hypothetical protein
MAKAKPHAEWGELHASTDFRELFWYKKGGKVQAYKLRVLSDDSAEVWIVSEYRGNPAGSEKGGAFTKRDEANGVPAEDGEEAEGRGMDWGLRFGVRRLQTPWNGPGTGQRARRRSAGESS